MSKSNGNDAAENTVNTDITPSLPTREMVTIKLYKDAGKYSQPVTVTINGSATVVPRGVMVQVSKDVADVLDMKEMQDNNTVDLIVGLQEDFRVATESLDKQ